MKDEEEIRDDLNYNKLCHKVLRVLIKKRIECEIYHKERNVDLAINRDDLCKKTKLSKDELFVVTSILKENGEIKVYSNDFFGYYAIQKGIFSYGENKYLNKEKNKNRENTKYYVQIVIPIITSLIAFSSIILNISQWKYSQLQEHKEIEKKYIKERTHSELNYLENETKNKETDSLKTEP